MNKILIGLLSVLLLGSIMVNILSLQKQQKTAFVILPQVFEEFNGKKEMEMQFLKSKNQRKQLLDSISIDLQNLQVKFNESPKTEELIQKMANKQAVFARLNAEFTSQEQAEDMEYSEKIWKQINQYSKEFGEQNGYDFIHGLSGSGSLMYAKPEGNITKDLIQYLNQRYEGL